MNDSISEEQERSNQRARRTWESKAVGSQRARSPSGTTAYFDEIRRYRFGYETPFIPDFFGFSSLGGKRVLEIGVGNGIDAFEMIRGGAIYTGLDITRNHLDLTRVLLASAKVDEVPGRVEALIEGDLLRTTLPGSYDVVYSFGVLHHIAHEDAYLRRIHGLLKPGGELRMAVYSRFSFFNAWLLMTWLLRNRTRNRFVDWQSHLAEHSPLGDPVVSRSDRGWRYSGCWRPTDSRSCGTASEASYHDTSRFSVDFLHPMGWFSTCVLVRLVGTTASSAAPSIRWASHMRRQARRSMATGKPAPSRMSMGSRRRLMQREQSSGRHEFR
jgi:2-polyprenyl-3-methyl-5-hydroxy-6-metoxy-1,4-benzoquinol methylase